MSSNLEQTTLGSIADILMGQSPPGETCNQKGLGIPLLNGPSEFGSYHPTPIQFTTDSRKLAKKNDLLFCVRGSTTGRMNWADQDYSIGRGLAALRHIRGLEYQPYLKALLETLLPDLLGSATGSTFPNVSRDQLAKAKIFLHSPDQQLAISTILSSLDDKIELNRQMCKTLEDIASTLFKSWFIDFDPVKAKAVGRAPEGLSPEIAELFPDSFVDSSLGKIPKGWEISELGKIAKNIKRNIKSSPETEILPYVPIDCITSTSLALHNHMPGILAKTSLIKFEKWQILFGAMRPYFHKVCIAPFAGTTRTTAFVLDPINAVDFSFLLITVFQKTTIDFAVNTSQGSTIPYAVWEGGMAKMPIILPPKHMRQVYNQSTINIFEKILSITEQNETLSLIRDLLLPRLMNGKIKIQEAEMIILATI